MKGQILSLFLLEFLMYGQIYTLHNYHLQVLVNTGVVTPKRFSLLYIFDIFKVIGILVLLNVCDKRGWHRACLVTCPIALGIVMFILYNLGKFCPVFIRMPMVVLTYIFFVLGQSGTIAILDSLCFNFLESEGVSLNTFGKIRSGGVFGNMFVQIFMFVWQKSFEKIRGLEEANRLKNCFLVYFFLIFGVLCSIACFFLAPNYKKSTIDQKSEKNNSKWNVVTFLRDLRILFTPTIIIYFFSVLAYGLERASFGGYFTKYLELQMFERSILYLLSLMRCIPEIFIYLFMKQIENILSLEGMFITSVLSSALRTFFYTMCNLKRNADPVLKFLPFPIEFLKGISSAFFNYSALRIFRNQATAETLSTSQGLFNANYNALAYIVYAMIGYSIIQSDPSKLLRSIRQLFITTSSISLVILLFPILLFVRNKIRINRKNRKEGNFK